MALSDKQREYQRIYYLKNREKRLAASGERQRALKEQKREYDAKRRKLKGDELREYDKARSKLHGARLRQMVGRARKRAAAKGTPFSLTTNDISIPEFCPALGIKLDWHDRQGGGDNSPSLDRLVPELGYVPGNVMVISSKANRIKTNATPKEVARVAEFMASSLAGGLSE